MIARLTLNHPHQSSSIRTLHHILSNTQYIITTQSQKGSNRRLRRLIASKQSPSLLLLDRSLTSPNPSAASGGAMHQKWCGRRRGNGAKFMLQDCASSMSLSTVMETGGLQTEPTLKSSCYNARSSWFVHSSQLLQPCSLSCQSIGAFDSSTVQ